MSQLEINRYLDIAQSTNIFIPQDFGILKEVLQDCQDNPTTNYILFDERQDKNILGFVIFGRIPMTEFSWDIYWLVVDKNFQGKGTGRKLLKEVESFIFSKQKRAILRVETSIRKEYTQARNLYVKQGFKQAGLISNFYGPGDDLIIFSKEISCLSARP